MITLSGVVGWRYQHDAAERAVRHISGETGIATTGTVRPTAPANGAKSAITAALVRHARLESRRITVTTAVVGVATIEGTVRSWSEGSARH